MGLFTVSVDMLQNVYEAVKENSYICFENLSFNAYYVLDTGKTNTLLVQ